LVSNEEVVNFLKGDALEVPGTGLKLFVDVKSTLQAGALPKKRGPYGPRKKSRSKTLPEAIDNKSTRSTQSYQNAAYRKKISQRMKEYWAKRKGKK
jgi:hypothetical protein